MNNEEKALTKIAELIIKLDRKKMSDFQKEITNILINAGYIKFFLNIEENEDVEEDFDEDKIEEDVEEEFIMKFGKE